MARLTKWYEEFLATLDDFQKARFLEVMGHFGDEIDEDDQLLIILVAIGWLNTLIQELPLTLHEFSEGLEEWRKKNLEILQNLVDQSDTMTNIASQSSALTIAVSKLNDILERLPNLPTAPEGTTGFSSSASTTSLSNGECTAWKAAQNIEGRLLKVEHILARHLGVRHWTLNVGFMLIGSIITYVVIRYAVPSLLLSFR